jgi:molybdopterin-containing oxidoreductase family iron-sulfur binding subunit
VNLRPDPTIADGRYATNGWLQELPKPVTRMVWGNAAMMSPRFAAKLGVTNEDVIDISGVHAPAFIVPGHADDSITLHLGHGRDGIGVNAYPLMTAQIAVQKTGEKARLVTTQEHNTLDGRDLLRVATIAEAQRDPDWARKPEKEPGRNETLYSNYNYSGHAWGMAIDLNACIGCGACVIACNAENNVPVVGREQVALGREMQWLRIDRYYAGDVDDPKIYHQPVLCMHCEDAPCEPVCPVGATVHSTEGLNEMVYNRCIGTRYCSNNCPYKVRRFNFLQYAPNTSLSELMANPDVTVRSRGVMEKCTYCVQRINEAKIDSEKQDRRIADGDIKTACQQTCPADAIVFGDLNDPNSRVAQLQKQERNYSLLGELNTRPRTTYLAAVRNADPELEA